MTFTITSPTRRNCFHSSGVTKPNVVMETSKSLLTQYIHSCYYYTRHDRSVGHLQKKKLNETFFSARLTVKTIQMTLIYNK